MMRLPNICKRVSERKSRTCLYKALIRQKCTSVTSADRQFQTGDKLHGYTVKQVADIPEFSMSGVTLEHDKTGAQHCHFTRDDANNFFSVLFSTIPMDNTGVPHILEHTALCGSQKFPVRDPFFKMLNRSLATFMNAFTASDWTMYPFSTQNQKDFQNLLSIYMDAAFYPQLRELDFSQEGWRLEHEDPSDPNSPILFKGVVYNEMKGVFSSSRNLYQQAVQNKLLPSHTYGVVSGGDPPAITNLTWQQLRDFHFSHYHPSNAKFITYGNLPLEEHLNYINSNYLSNFDKIQVDAFVPTEPRWTEPRTEHIHCAFDPMAPEPEKQTTLSVNYLLTDITDSDETFTLSIIGTLLVDGETSPFYQTLIKSNIGSDYAPVTGFDDSLKESIFCVGLQGIHPDDTDKVKRIIEETFDTVISEGFDPKNIEAVLHRVELSLKKESQNFGLQLTMALASKYNHDSEPLKYMKMNEHVEKFRKRLAENPNFLQEKVKQYFKNNPHRLVLTMSPEENFEEKRKEEEEQRLKKFVDGLSGQDKETILKTGKDLASKQSMTEDISCLPTIHLHEIDKKIKPEPTDHIFVGGVPVQSCIQPTNGLTYLRLFSNLNSVPPELLHLVPLFCSVITKMNAGTMNYMELSQEIDLHTGGLSADVLVHSDHTVPDEFEQGVVFSSYCLDRNLDRMLELWTEIFCRSDLKDIERLLTLIKMEAAGMASSVVDRGHMFAMTHAMSSLSAAAHLQEQYGGMTQLKQLKTVAEGDRGSVLTVKDHLEEIGKCLLNEKSMRVAVNATPDQMDVALRKTDTFLHSLKGTLESTNFLTKDDHFIVSEHNTQFEMPFAVNYVSKAIQTVPMTHKDFPVLRVLSKLMSAKYLHREIREKGGAYGSGALCENGLFALFSYRDPNSEKTLQVFDDAVAWLNNGEFSDADVTEAQLAIFKEIDKPVTSGSAGMKLFLSDITDEMRQEMRDSMFEVTKKDIVRVSLKYLQEGKQPSSKSVLGPTNENLEKDSTWHVIKS